MNVSRDGKWLELVVNGVQLPHQGKKLPPNIDENAEEGDVSDEDSADEMEDDCKLMNEDVCNLFLLNKCSFGLHKALENGWMEKQLCC